MLCGNPDCGEVIDGEGTPLLDKEQDCAVFVCDTCVRQLAGHYRYEPLYEYEEPVKPPTEGAP